jgi:hypothetical protein
MEDSLLKQAEQQVVNRAIQLREINKILDALRSFSYKYCNEYVAGKEFDQGLQMMRSAIYREFADACCNLTIFAGIGGGEAEQFCRNEFKRLFSDEQRFAVMGFLESNGSNGHSYLTSDEEKLRQEAREQISEWDK